MCIGGAYFPLDVERETGRIVMPDRAVIDIAMLRGSDIVEDLAARDFTVNALARSLANPGHLIDPFDGESDLRAKDRSSGQRPGLYRRPGSAHARSPPRSRSGFRHRTSYSGDTGARRARRTRCGGGATARRTAPHCQQPERGHGSLDAQRTRRAGAVLPQARVDAESLRVIANLLDVSTPPCPNAATLRAARTDPLSILAGRICGSA